MKRSFVHNIPGICGMVLFWLLANIADAQWYDPDGVGTGDDWQYRVPIAIPATGAVGSTIVLDVDFDALFNLLGITPGTLDFDEASPRIVRPGGTLAAQQEFTDRRFGGLLDASNNAQGEIKFILDDAPAAGNYLLYFDAVENGVKSANPQPTINGNFEHSAGTVPTNWTRNGINTGGNERNLVQTTAFGATASVGAGCSSNGANNFDNSPNNNGTTATGDDWYLLGYRENCEDGGGGVEQVQLRRTFTNPSGAARGNLTFFFHLQTFDGIESSGSNYDYIRVWINGGLLDHRTITIDNTTAPTLRIRNRGISRPSYGNSLVDFGWKQASIDMTQYPAGSTSLIIETRHSSTDEGYRLWTKLDDVEWAIQSGVLGTPESFSTPEFVINHDTFGIHCLAETITVNIVDGNSGAAITTYNEPVTLDTQSGNGTWTLVTGSGAFADATVDDGLAGYDWPLGESQAVFQLSYPQGTPSIDIDVYQNSDTSIRDTDAEGPIQFSPNGFTLTAAALSNPPPGVITPFDAAQTAALPFSLHLAAFGQTPTDPVCGVIESYAGNKSLKFWFDYVDPGTGTRIIDIDSAPIATAEGSAAGQNVAFINGQAQVVGFYKDVGMLQIHVKDDSTVNAELPGGIRGATANFVSRPDRFLISNVRDAAGVIVNPQAADASGAEFIAAGSAFRMTVTALDADNDATPNYGRESNAETVRVATALVAPLAGANPPISATIGFGPFTGGTATGTDFVWPEVGIVSVTPGIGDGDYLGAGDVTGSVSQNIGRFVPDRFDVSLNLPMFGTACAAGGFSYVGETFDYLVAPVITATARAVGGTTTLNYSGAFFKLSTATLANRLYQASSGTLDTSGLPPPATDPAVVEISPGIATLTFGGGSGLGFARTVAEAPFAADIELSIDVIDDDGVLAPANPVTFGAGAGIAFDAGDEIRYGRIRIGNALGSELVDLDVLMLSEYYLGPAAGFVTHVADSCASAVTLSFADFTDALNPGETCAADTGAPGASGVGCATPAPVGQRYEEPPVAGSFNLRLAAPGNTNQGSLTVTGSVPSWLQYDWDSSVAGDEDPTGQVTFGVYQGAQRRIYMREVY